MFVALFPCSEVIYGLAIFFTWLYIATGMLGNMTQVSSDVTVGQESPAHIQNINNQLQSSSVRECYLFTHHCVVSSAEKPCNTETNRIRPVSNSLFRRSSFSERPDASIDSINRRGPPQLS